MSKQLMHEAFVKMQTEMKQADRLIQQGELIKAEAIYHQVLNKEQNYPLALYGLSELADKIDDQEVREDLLARAIEQVKHTKEHNQRAVLAIWLAEQAEALIRLGRQKDANLCVAESERMIQLNLLT